MTFKFGPPKPLDGITADDVLAHSIWVWVWEAGLEEQAGDETWQCPVLDATDVSEAMTEPVITLRVEGSGLVASASYDAKSDRLEAISVWQDGAWVGVEASTLPVPIVFVAVPTIRGVAGARFLCTQRSEDRAARVR